MCTFHAEDEAQRRTSLTDAPLAPAVQLGALQVIVVTSVVLVVEVVVLLVVLLVVLVMLRLLDNIVSRTSSRTEGRRINDVRPTKSSLKFSFSFSTNKAKRV